MASMTLQEIADRIEIDDLLTRYATAVDKKDWDLFTACFTPDALIDYTAVGGIKGNLQEVKKWLAEVLPMFPMTQHVVTNKVVELRGDTATSRCILFNPMGLPDGKGGMVLFIDGAYYNDELVRTAQGWRMAKRAVETAYTTRSHAILPPS
jgi:3-phenylpropionate/cinnamic acid dioxygenase small subunit